MSDAQFIPVSAPLETDSAGRGGEAALVSVVRIECPDQNSGGTGFLHKSGHIITAEHVVRSCAKPHLIRPDGIRGRAKIVALDQVLDLAVLRPISDLPGQPLAISAANEFAIGTQVSTWGFPSGYNGLAPLLSVGYLAGLQVRQFANGSKISQWIVNAAFNSGNSGGPLIHIESGQVVGVVSSKLAPISPFAKSALDEMAKNKSGVVYTVTKIDGTTENLVEGQIVAMILNELRQQLQLVIGMAATVNDLRQFLTANQIEP